MATLASRITSTGTYQVSGSFDEVSYNPNSTVKVNVLPYSQSLKQGNWSFGNCQVFTTTTTVAPDGTLTAYKVVANTGTATTNYYGNTSFIAPSTGTYQTVISIYAKPAERNSLAFSFSTAGWIVFNLGTQQVTSISTGAIGSGAGHGGFVSGSVTSAANGWYRVSALTTAEYVNPWQPAMASGTNLSFIGDGVSGIYLWGGQVELSSAGFPSDYVATTASAALLNPPITKTNSSGIVYAGGGFDEVTYNPTSGVTKNLLLYSQDFTQTSAWSAQIAVTLTKTNAVTAPDGSNTAIQYYLSAPSGRGVDQHINFVTGITYTFSIYLNAIQNTTYYLSHVDNSTTVITGQSGAITTGTGWNRVSFTFTATTATSFIQFGDFSGNTGNMFYCWGSQLEIGTTATSYVATSSTTIPVKSFVQRTDNQGNVYVADKFDEVTGNLFTWTFTATTAFLPTLTGWGGIQSSLKGGLADGNLFDGYSMWGSIYTSNPYITAIFPTTYNVTNIYVGAAYPNSPGYWGVSYTNNGTLQSSMDGINWTTLTNISGVTLGKVSVFPVNTTANYIRAVALSGGAYLAVSEFYFDASWYFNTGVKPVNTNGLVGYWSANSSNSYPGTGTIWYDISGQSNNATLVGTYSYNTGTSFNMLGTGYATISSKVVNGLASSATEFSVAVWFNYTSTATYTSMFEKQNGPGGGIPRMDLGYIGGGTNTLYWTTWNQPTGVTNDMTYSTGINSGTWYHTVLTCSSSTFKIGYLNGQKVASVAVTANWPDATQPFGIGGYSRIMNGQIGETEIYNRSLSAAEVLDLFNSTRSKYGL